MDPITPDSHDALIVFDAPGGRSTHRQRREAGSK
jgi:hypothetical protein